MEEKDIVKIIKANASNQFVFDGLGDAMFDVLELLEVLPAEDFKEVNPDGKFSFDDLPIRLDLNKDRFITDGIEYSLEIKDEIEKLYQLINSEGTNIEYPYLFVGKDGVANKIIKFSDGEKQVCSFDWARIEEEIKAASDGDNIVLFHTHPKPIGEEFDTLYSRHKELLGSLGVRADGLNLSVSDLFLLEYAEKVAKENNKNLNIQGLVLMHNGEVVSYNMKGGFNLNYIKVIKHENVNETENKAE